MSAMLILRLATSVKAVAMTAASKIRTAIARSNPDDLFRSETLATGGSAADGGAWEAFGAGSPSCGMFTVSFVSAIPPSYLKKVTEESNNQYPSSGNSKAQLGVLIH